MLTTTIVRFVVADQVIPAQAGIQSERQRSSIYVVRVGFWTPAFAVVTWGSPCKSDKILAIRNN